MRKIIRLTERDLTKLVKRVLNERHRDFNEILEMVESIEQHFDSFFKNVLSKRTDDFEKHPDFPLEYIIRFVLSTIKENPNLVERMYNKDYYVFYDTILTRPSHTISSWLNLYCFMNYEMGLRDPEICNNPEDVNWEIVKKETNKEVNVVNNNNIKLTPPKTPNVKTIHKNTKRTKIPDRNDYNFDYNFDYNRYNINIYSTYEDMLKFMSEFEPYVESLKPKDLICSDEIMRILIILSETLQKKIKSLQNKYSYNKSPKKSSTSDTDDEKINDFIKKYGGYNREIFYDLAKKFADDINIPYQLVTNKYDEKYKKIWSDDVGYDKTKLNQDSEYIKAKELRDKVHYYIECCDNGRWICDDPPPPPFYPPRDDYDYKYNKINVDYNPTIKGGGPSTTNDKSGSKDRMSEQIRRTLRKLL